MKAKEQTYPNHQYNISLFINKMKHQQKIDLKSHIYKQKNSKSPFTSKKLSGHSQNNSIGKIFQNICCPNCRYLFKVIKEQIHPKNLSFTLAKEQQSILTTTATQTNENQLKMKISRKNQIILTQRTEKSPAQSLLQLDSSRKQIVSKISGFQGSSSKTPQKINKIELNTSGKSKPMNKQSSIFPSRKTYTQQNNQSSIAISPSKKKASVENTNDKKTDELINRIYLSEEIKQILHYNIDDAPKISMPSYCKMLLYDLLDRKKAMK